jgi:hypothetical protein
MTVIRAGEVVAVNNNNTYLSNPLINCLTAKQLVFGEYKIYMQSVRVILVPSR